MHPNPPGTSWEDESTAKLGLKIDWLFLGIPYPGLANYQGRVAAGQH